MSVSTTLQEPLTQRREIPGAIRAAVSSGRTREAILATDQMVDVYDYQSGRIVAEILLIEGATWRDPTPALLDHERRLPAMVGSVTNHRREPSKLVGTFRFAKGTQTADEAWELVSGNHVTDVSVGYSIKASTEINAGQSKTVAGRVFTAPAGRPLRVVSAWELREVSVVPIGADNKAGFRSSPDSTFRSTSPMTTVTPIPTRNIDQMRFTDFATAILQSRGEPIPENQADRLQRAFSTVDGASDLFGLFSQMVLDGWRQGVDTLDGVARIVSANNYLEQQLAAVSVHPRMEWINRGGVAPVANFAVVAKGCTLMRFGLRFVIDERYMLDGERIGVYRLAIEEAMRAARNMVSDLQWAAILKNETCADGVALFDATRGNLDTAVFGDTGFQSAYGAIAGQTGVDEADLPIHYNLTPRFLIVSPDKRMAANKVVRPYLVDGSEIVVRSESRLSDTGLVDPTDGETLIQGNGTNWLLAAPGEQKASIVLSLFNGKTDPTVRQFALEAGQWGYGFDVSFACAVAAIDGTALYWSSGTV